MGGKCGESRFGIALADMVQKVRITVWKNFAGPSGNPMTEVIFQQDEGEDIVVDLRDPFWAAVLAWVFPGAGHIYQRRFPKGLLFMVCILSSYFAGLALGEGRVVYASTRANDFRWQYFCQLGVGLPAFPAIVQSMMTSEKDKNGERGDPMFVLCERYPEGFADKHPDLEVQDFHKVDPDKLPAGTTTYKDGFMAPPAGPLYVNENDVLGQWHFELKHFFEIGTLFTVVAGLLNLLAVYDAFSGPAILSPEEREEMENKKRKKSKRETV
jgi:hypothetical protein